MNYDPTVVGAGIGFAGGVWVGHISNQTPSFLKLFLVSSAVAMEIVQGKKTTPKPTKKKFNKDVILWPLMCGIFWSCMGAGVASTGSLAYRSIKYKLDKKNE